MRRVVPKSLHLEARREMVGALCAYQDKLCPAELLAVASQVVGSLIALQDETRLTPEHAMEIVLQNIEEGNRAANADLAQKTDAA